MERLRNWRDVRAQFQTEERRNADRLAAEREAILAATGRFVAFREGGVVADAEARERVRTAVTERDARVLRLEQERRVHTNHSAQLPIAPPTWTEEDATEERLDEGARAHIREEMAERKQLLVLQRAEVRVPGWKVPGSLRNKWPLYETEAVTLDTPYGQVTVGRSLARIFDMGGWPDESTLRSMVEEQSARFHGGRF